MKWINIKEKLPTIHHEVLLFMPSISEGDDSSNYAVGYLENDDGFYFNNYGENIEAVDIMYISHWMQLPEPPE